ncbi:CHAD domain-containing protein [Streptomyces olivaceus]|uniref:CHAD domain-containing protein n=1 Tax=Streptomyces olivaceus TaxID=47716 RepID=UPI003F4D1AEC
MAQQHLEPTDPSAGSGPPAPPGTVPGRGTTTDVTVHTRAAPASAPAAPATALAACDAEVLARYLRAQATEFLRALRQHRESGTGPNGTPGPHRTAPPSGHGDAALALRRAARRISGTLHTFQSLLDTDWAEGMRPELAWLSGTLAMEHAYASRLERLLDALHRLSGPPAAAPRAVADRTTATAPTTVPPPAPAAPSAPSASLAPAPRAAAQDRGNLTVGAAKAGALLDRQLTLARTRAHSSALQALGSSRFHAVADKVALLASEVPLRPAAAPADLRPLAAAAHDRLTDAVAALPLVAAGSPYNAQALVHGLSPDPAPHPQDAPWHQVRLLLRLHRYAVEVLAATPPGNTGEAASNGEPADPSDVLLLTAGDALSRHRDASEAAAAAAQAARTPRIAPATAYALGVLHADQRHEVEAARYAFQHCWRGAPVRPA